MDHDGRIWGIPSLTSFSRITELATRISRALLHVGDRKSGGCACQVDANAKGASQKSQKSLGATAWAIWSSQWGFPEIGLPPNHPFSDGIFHEINHHLLGTPMAKETSLNLLDWSFGTVLNFPNNQQNGFLMWLWCSFAIICHVFCEFPRFASHDGHVQACSAPRLRTSEDVYHRILHDSARFDPKDVTIGCLFAELCEFSSLLPGVRDWMRLIYNDIYI